MVDQNSSFKEWYELASKQIEKLKSLPIITSALTKLRNELPEDLFYHAAEHTDDVLFEVILYGMVDHLPDRSLELLGIAAAYHDLGYIEAKNNNEAIGADLAKRAMINEGGYSEEEIRTVEVMILDTKLVETSTGPMQIASTELSKYLLDADLSNLGREDFFDKVELQLKEVSQDEGIFLQKASELTNNHSWLTDAAKNLRQEKKEQNICELKSRLAQLRSSVNYVTYLGVSLERLGFLTRLPMLLNSSLSTKEIVNFAITKLKSKMEAEAATVFLVDDKTGELTFWALDSSAEHLEGKKMQGGKGIVGWVIEKQESVVVEDVKEDPRFFDSIDREGEFVTRSVVCVPLVVRGDRCLGAVQVLNSKQKEGFVKEDLIFTEHVANQLAMAIDNATLHESLVTRHRRLEALERRKNDIITMIAHEFRTPLNVIQTSADVLAGGLLSCEKDLKNMSDTLMNGVRRLTKLVSEIKNVSLVSGDKRKVKLEQVSLPEVVESMKNKFMEAFLERNLALEISVDPEIKLVKADIGLLTVVLSNLISNAVRFTPDGGTVTLRVEISAGHAVVSVQDTGIGIASEHLPLIFEKFYEVADVMEHSSGTFEFKSNGLGLGLATAQAILNAHGSSLDVESKIGKGSTFSFRLALI